MPRYFGGENLFYFIIKWKVFFKNAKIHSKLAASRILGSGFCSWASILRGIFVAVWPPVLFLSPVPQVSHPFPTVAHPYSQLGVTNKCCLGRFLTSLQLLLEIKTEIEVEMLIVVITKLVSRT